MQNFLLIGPQYWGAVWMQHLHFYKAHCKMCISALGTKKRIASERFSCWANFWEEFSSDDTCSTI